MTQSSDICNFLNGLPHVTNVTPCTITIGRQAYPAARYVQDGRNMVYCAGLLPKPYLRSGRLAFVMPDSANEWYVACYSGRIVDRKQECKLQTKIHPFGNSFILAEWNLPDRIDAYESRPYRRIPVGLTLA